jgi:ribosomal RNA-processing protein 7
MSVTKTPKAKKQKGPPTSVADFVVLPLSLPTHPSLPPSCADAKHYLYIKPHAPSQPTESSPRSLFLANLPIDATESNLRALFADQLGGARVETVQFHASIPAVVEHKRFKSEELKVTKSNDSLANRGTKRKREDAASGKAGGKEMVAEGVVEDQDSALPRIWNREIHPSGSGAVVVFLDKASMKGAMSQVQKVVNEGKEIQWVGGEALGAERMVSPHLLVVRAEY